MTLLKIAQLGHPVLITPARPVLDPSAPEIQELIDDMIETLADARGLGLAAPQVHQSLRLLIALPVTDREASRTLEPLVLVDPELEMLGEETSLDMEGCLSIPGLRGVVPRAARVAWRGLDRHGSPVAGEAEGLFARVLQHEVDHLDGVLYPMRMADLRLLAFNEEIHHLNEVAELIAGAP
jgi:peptide deformylase